MHFGHTASEACLSKIAQNGHKKMSNAAMVHPECQVFHMMPHPPLHIWACPCNWSLQQLYLPTTITKSFITKAKSRVMSSLPYFLHLGKAHPRASGLEVVQLLLVNVHLDWIPTSDCSLQRWHVLHWQPQHARGQTPWGVRWGVGGLATQR